MKRIGIGLIAAGALAVASIVTALPAAAMGFGGARAQAASPATQPSHIIPAGNGGMIYLPPMGGRGMGGMSGMRSGIGEMGRGGRPYPGTVWRGNPGVNGFQGGKVYRNGQVYAGNRYRAGNRYYAGKHGWNGKHGWKGYGYHNGRYKGPRYRYRYPGYNYFYGGFWYPWPWWSVGYYGGGYNDYGYGGGYGASAHVEWCLNRYRSYDPRTNTYMGYDGRRHSCNSPFD